MHLFICYNNERGSLLMAQVLKKDKEELILNISRDLFLKKGYDKTSMKDIAKKTWISVGNLYRYYKNKPDIVFNIIKPLFEKIDVFVKENTNGDISIFSYDFSFDKKDIIKPKEISKLIEKLIQYLVDLYDDYSDEFILINSCPEVINYLKKWLNELICYFIEKKYRIVNIFHDEVMVLVPSYTNAIIEGAINIFKDRKLSSVKKKKILSIYFNSYISMLDIKHIMVR